MAKITARGAKEVARLTAARPGSPGTRALFVLASDGRVLRRLTEVGGDKSNSTGYNVVGTVQEPANRNRAFLARFAGMLGWREVPGA